MTVIGTVVVILILSLLLALFVLKWIRPLDKRSLQDVIRRIRPDEQVFFQGLATRNLIRWWPFLPVEGALAVTDHRLLWKQIDGFPLPFMFRREQDIDLIRVQDVKDFHMWNTEAVRIVVDGSPITLVPKPASRWPFSKANADHSFELTNALRRAKAAYR